MESKSKHRRKGIAKLAHKVRHFRSGKLYKVWRRKCARLKGRPLVHFIHVRKAGGSAIKAVLVPHAMSGPNLIECHPHRITLDHIPAGEKFFFVVRDPVRRYVSGFNSRLNQGAPAHEVPWNKEEERVFRDFRTPNELAMALTDKDPPRRKLALHAMKTISHVRSSYWDWFIDEQTLKSRADDVLMVLRQNDLHQDFQRLIERLELPSGIELSSDPIIANQSLKETSRELEPAAEAAIRNYYSQDYHFIEICRERFALRGDL